MRDVDSNVRKRKRATAATDGRPRPQRPTQAPSAPDESTKPHAAAPRGHGRPLSPLCSARPWRGRGAHASNPLPPALYRAAVAR